MLSIFNKLSSLGKLFQPECWIFAEKNSMHLKMIKEVANKLISLCGTHLGRAILQGLPSLERLSCCLLISRSFSWKFLRMAQITNRKLQARRFLCASLQPGRDKHSKLGGKARKGRTLEHRGFRQPRPKLSLELPWKTTQVLSAPRRS